MSKLMVFGFGFVSLTFVLFHGSDVVPHVTVHFQSALAASPCSTPVLATLLGYVATSRDPVIGGSLLLTYTTGYVAPLIVGASFAGALQVSAWINPISGSLLLGGGL